MTLDHEHGCNGRTFTKCESHMSMYNDGSRKITVVRMEWCGDCRATDHEVVSP